MYSAQLLEHFRNPRGVGELPPPAVTVEVSNPACGDVMRLSVMFEGGRVADARYYTRGCTASIAAGSATVEWLRGRTGAEVAALNAQVIESLLGGLPAASRHAAALCADAVRAAYKAASA